MDVIESDFTSGNLKVGIELLNGLAVGGGVGQMDLSLGVGTGHGAGCQHKKIGFAEDRIVISSKGLELSDIGVVEAGAHSESAVAGDVAVLESGGSVEFGGGVLAPQSGAAQGDGLKGK